MIGQGQLSVIEKWKWNCLNECKNENIMLTMNGVLWKNKNNINYLFWLSFKRDQSKVLHRI